MRTRAPAPSVLNACHICIHTHIRTKTSFILSSRNVTPFPLLRDSKLALMEMQIPDRIREKIMQIGAVDELSH